MTLDALVKIGGSVLRGPGDYARAAEEVRRRYVEAGARVAVVVSAAKGVTDLLVKAVEGSREAAREVVERYDSIARELGGPALARLVAEALRPLEALGARRANARAAGRILGLGEAASRVIMVHALEAAGVRALGVPARLVVKAVGDPLSARIDYEATREAWASALKLADSSRVTLVVEGFAAEVEGAPGVLGRGGSDYTAVALAALSTAKTAHLVTDVDGIRTGVPEVVPGTRRVEAMGYIEAVEAARWGAKRMHPRTFEPLLRVRPVEVRIGSWDSWTRVEQAPFVEPPRPKLVASRRLPKASIVSLVGSRVASPGILARAAEALAEAGVEPLTVSSPPSRASLSFTVDPGVETRALRALHRLVAEEGVGRGG
ncbi:amino acid kinase family protein [Stetteria hydrogenophila]